MVDGDEGVAVVGDHVEGSLIGRKRDMGAPEVLELEYFQGRATWVEMDRQMEENLALSIEFFSLLASCVMGIRAGQILIFYKLINRNYLLGPNFEKNYLYLSVEVSPTGYSDKETSIFWQRREQPKKHAFRTHHGKSTRMAPKPLLLNHFQFT
jgi:hypothetical protein